MGANQFDCLALGAAIGDDIVDNEDPSFQRSTDHCPAFTVVLGFLSVIAVRQIVTFFGQSNGRRGGQGDALVGRAEKLIACHAGDQIGLGIELAEAAQAFSVIEQSGVEKIGGFASCLGDEFAESKHVACQSKLEKRLTKLGHRKGKKRGVATGLQSIPRPKDSLCSCGSSHST